MKVRMIVARLVLTQRLVHFYFYDILQPLEFQTGLYLKKKKNYTTWILNCLKEKGGRVNIFHFICTLSLQNPKFF